ncbi:MAG: FKBP-type peptidyl-prolyl cis-trans isomerase [Saprospiraceae bacterium]
MKGLKLFAVLFLAASVSLNAQNKIDSAAYSIGVLIAQSLKSGGIESVNSLELAKGLEDALKGTPKIDMQKAQEFYTKYSADQSKKKYAGNVEKGKKFLDENKKRSGIVVLPSGMQYEILKAGTGPKPGPTDKVKTHYHGTLIDGTVFDSSVQRGEPIEFPVNGVIKGWTEALQLMPTGSKWKLYIPSDLAYGERGAGGSIGPFETLIFEVELLAVNPPAAEPAHGDGDGHKH